MKINKRYFSKFIATLFVFCAPFVSRSISNSVSADTNILETNNSAYVVRTNDVDEHVHDDGTTFTETITSSSGVLSPRSYYLDEDVTLSSNITISSEGEVLLCLNGHVLTGNGKSSVISITYRYSSLILYDCQDGITNNTVSGNTYSSGVITGGYASFGGGVFVTGSFTMNGGTIAHNTASYNNGANGNGGGVYVSTSYSSFTMNGGTITNNSTANSGGAIYTSGTFIMNGGKITDNTASNLGGGIYALINKVIFNGGYFNGAIRYNYGTITITGGYFGTNAYNTISEEFLSNAVLLTLTASNHYNDPDYDSDFPYAAYENVLLSNYGLEIADISVDCEEMETYSPTITDTPRNYSLSYTYNNGTQTVNGLPREYGEWDVTATFSITAGTYGTYKTYIANDQTETRTFKVKTIHTFSSNWIVIEEGVQQNTCDLCETVVTQDFISGSSGSPTIPDDGSGTTTDPGTENPDNPDTGDNSDTEGSNINIVVIISIIVGVVLFGALVAFLFLHMKKKSNSKQY